MKNRILLLLLTSLFVLFCGSLKAQDGINYSDTSSTGSMSGKTKFLPNDGRFLKSASMEVNTSLPDLQISSFSVKSSTFVKTTTIGGSSYNVYKATYQAVVQNTGNSKSTECDLMSEFFMAEKTGAYAYTYSNCDKFDPLSAGNSRTVNGTMQITVPVSQKQVKVRLYIDADCPKQTLPAYNKVLEQYENNNYSDELTIKL